MMFAAEQSPRPPKRKTDGSFVHLPAVSLALIATVCYSIHPVFISRFPSTLRFLFPNQSIGIGRPPLDKLSSNAVFVSFDTFRYFQVATSRPCVHRPGNVINHVVLVSVAALCSLFSGSGVGAH